MKAVKEWKNVPGVAFVEVDKVDGEYVTVDGDPLPGRIKKIVGEIMKTHPDVDLMVLNINFLSSGYNDPGVLTGPVETCYPPEYDDERLVDSVDLDTDRGVIKDAVAQEFLDVFEDEYRDLIYDADLEEQSEGDDDAYDRWKDEHPGEFLSYLRRGK